MRFAGRVSDAEAARLLASCRALVVTTGEEFGIAAVEAQAAGRPVIARAAGGLLENVIDGVTGCLWEGGADELAEAVSRFDADAVDRRRASRTRTASTRRCSARLPARGRGRAARRTVGPAGDLAANPAPPVADKAARLAREPLRQSSGALASAPSAAAARSAPARERLGSAADREGERLRQVVEGQPPRPSWAITSRGGGRGARGRGPRRAPCAVDAPPRWRTATSGRQDRPDAGAARFQAQLHVLVEEERARVERAERAELVGARRGCRRPPPTRPRAAARRATARSARAGRGGEGRRARASRAARAADGRCPGRCRRRSGAAAPAASRPRRRPGRAGRGRRRAARRRGSRAP